ncbi:hypothetical protein D9Q98_008632 [Chlorella vulgaris]|uniref:OTU domain-containing protein n=1 Tax=Chlorella vulgaris TaxID=3077 RepID=A0A9D4YUE8_CHLVU|nr:hypothetical protein D9Q98_008632 [Chlorella vulgaris]
MANKKQGKGGVKKHKQRADKTTPNAQTADGQRDKQQRRRNKQHHYAKGDVETEIAALGLRIKTIAADGNCFYRAVLDQLQGEGGDHLALRGRVMDHIAEREEQYRFFMEDDEPFDKYVKRMRQPGAWAGHVELQVTALLLKRDIHVYQAGQPVWRVSCGEEDAPALHVSYHDGMHYNSVRNAGDHGTGPPEPLRLLAAAAADLAAVAAAARCFGREEVQQVMQGTGCSNPERVSRVLERCGGCAEQAIEQLIEQMGEEEGFEQERQASGEAAAGEQQAGAVTGAAAMQQSDVEGSAAGLNPSMQQEAGNAAVGSSIGSTNFSGGSSSVVREVGQLPADDSIRLELRMCGDESGHVVALLLPLVGSHDSQQTIQQQQQQQQQDAAPGSKADDAAEEQKAAETQRRGAKRQGGKKEKGMRIREVKVAAASWVLNGGGEISPSSADFPQVVFAKWCWLLQQVGEQLPYGEENWQTVLGALTESCQQLTAIGLECGIASQLARQLVTAHLSGCTSKAEVKEQPAEQPPPQQQAANTPTASGPQQRQRGEVAAPKSTGGRTPATRVALAPLTLSAQGGEALASAAAAGCGAAVEGQENVVRPNHQQPAPKGAGTASGRKMALRGQAPLSSKRTRV